MIQFEFVARKTEEAHVHSNVELFYVMDGIARFTLEDQQYVLRRDDFLVVNVDKKHAYVAEGDFLAVCMHISFAELCRMLKQNAIFFWCNTAVENSEACGELRGVIKKIVAEQYHHQEQNVIYLNSLYYELLHVLTTDFLLNKEDRHYGEEASKFDARKHEIEEYIRLNFDKQISLEDLANQLFLSYAYLSKYIKRRFGMGFADYLNSVRLNYAVSQLLHSDQSVVRIAMESGFASSSALNKTFKEYYHTTPTEYRKQRRSKWEKNISNQEEQELIRRQLSRHFVDTKEPEQSGKRLSEETVVLQSGQKRLLRKNWCRMINMGTAMDLLQSEMQKHLLFLKDELHFEYVRFWDLYDPDMFLDIAKGAGGHNFDSLDRVLDFLLQNGLKPYIELRDKPKKILVNRDKLLLYKDEGMRKWDQEDVESFLRNLIIHLLNRYNSDQVETWYFEVWHAEPEEVLLQVELAESSMPTLQYLDQFQIVSRVLREYLPGIKLGGGGFSLRYGEHLFRSVLETWKGMEYLPDFVSIYCYPYTQESVDRGRNQSKSADFLRDSLTKVRQIMEETEFPAQELHVSEWSFSVSNRNVLNDHCMKGAYLVRNMLDSIDLVDMMGYWMGSDLYAGFYDSKTVLNGSCGLLSKDGIRKPAFYAFEFMNHLGRYVRKRGEHYVITDNGAGTWRIVCHNLKSLNYQYGLQQEDEIRIKEQNNIFSDLKKYRIHFELPGETDGKYLLRIRSVNHHSGSVQDEWLTMAQPKELSRDDLEYLSRITTPRMVLRDCVAENGKIVFDLTLEPNEIAYIHVTYQYS